VTGAAAPHHRTLWPWLGLGAIVIAVLGARLYAAGVSSHALPVVATVPSFSLVDQDGDAFGSADLEGKVWIASFIYTTCPGPCPRVVQRLAEVQRRLGGEPDLRIVSFSVDPAADTPPVLHTYAEARGIDAARWRLLTGTVDDVVSLVRRGFLLALARNDGSAADTLATEGPVVHSIRLVLVDPQMRIRGYYDSSDPAAVDRLIDDTRTLLRAST